MQPAALHVCVASMARQAQEFDSSTQITSTQIYSTQMTSPTETYSLIHPHKFLLLLVALFLYFIFALCLATLFVVPWPTLAIKSSSCHFCAKNIYKNHINYTLNDSFSRHSSLRCHYINGSGHVLKNYAGGVKIKQECLIGVSIGLSVAFVLCMCTSYLSICCCFTIGCHHLREPNGELKSLEYPVKLSDVLVGVFWPCVCTRHMYRIIKYKQITLTHMC
jgi:hypothetical protein